MTVKVSLGVLEERRFRLLFLGQAVTAVGDRMGVVAVPFAVLAVTRSASAVGVVLAAYTLSMVLAMLLGGVVGDRLSRRNVMIAADLTRAGSQGVTAVLLIDGTAAVWHLALAQSVNGVAMAFFIPAGQGLIPDVVGPACLQQANALLSLSRNVSGIAGPALAALLISSVGPGWAIGADALSFLASATVLSRLSVPSVARRSTPILVDLRLGWREFTRRTWVWFSVLTFSLFHLVVLASVSVLGPYVAVTELGGVSAWATIMVAASLGAVAGSAVALRWIPRRPGVVVFGSLVPHALPLALLAVAAPVPLIAIGMAVAVAAVSLGGAVWFTMLQERVSEEARSRVSSYDWMGSLLFMPLGLSLVGPVSDAIGVTAMLSAAAVWSVLAGLSVLVLPSMRSLLNDRPVVAAARSATGKETSD